MNGGQTVKCELAVEYNKESAKYKYISINKVKTSCGSQGV